MKRTFDFETNIEKRMPTTVKVFFVDRMTSDYATAHPFDVDGFIEEVYNMFAGTEYEENRDALRRTWTAVLSVKSQRGDASLYPNKNGAKRPAQMQVWGKAGDYWRRGLRIGDELPAIVPACKITRLDNGEWIALFPKDMGLLDAASEECRVKSEEFYSASEISQTPTPSAAEPDLFAQMQQEITEQQEQSDVRIDYAESRRDSTNGQLAELRQENERLRAAAAVSVSQTEATQNGDSPRSAIGDSTEWTVPSVASGNAERPCVPSPRPRRVRRQKQDVMSLYSSPAITVDHSQEDDHSERNRKIFAAVATAVVFVVLVNTVGLFGIAALGLLAGGIVK